MVHNNNTPHQQWGIEIVQAYVLLKGWNLKLSS
jgi:hypothetical protein